MKPFNVIKSCIIPLDINNIDTDMIIPAQFLTTINREGYGEFLFQGLRLQDDDFAFNDPDYQLAQIVVSRRNFGCGSSREHAVWALVQFGIKVIIAESFSDIFFNNAAKNGLLLIELGADSIDELIAMKKSNIIEINLEEQSVTTATGKEYSFDYDPFRKSCFIKGYSDLDYLLEVVK